MKLRRTIPREALAKVDAADDPEDKRGDRQEDRSGRHQAEEQPGDVRPAERRRDEHGRPPGEEQTCDGEEGHHRDPVFPTDGNPPCGQPRDEQLDVKRRFHQLSHVTEMLDMTEAAHHKDNDHHRLEEDRVLREAADVAVVHLVEPERSGRADEEERQLNRDREHEDKVVDPVDHTGRADALEGLPAERLYME